MSNAVPEQAVEAAAKIVFAEGIEHGWWKGPKTYEALDPIGKEEFDTLISRVLTAALPHTGQPQEGDAHPTMPFTHTRSCPSLTPGDGPCTCALEERRALQTEREMHRAWRKRAEEVERKIARLSVAPASPRAEDELCAACGEHKREHAPGGTRWGPTSLCGVFIPAEQPQVTFCYVTYKECTNKCPSREECQERTTYHRNSQMPATEENIEALAKRLNQHAEDFELTESEPDEPGRLVHDLRHAAAVIPQFLMNLRHRD